MSVKKWLASGLDDIFSYQEWKAYQRKWTRARLRNFLKGFIV